MLNFRSKLTVAVAVVLSLGLGVWVAAQEKEKADKPASEAEKKAAIKDASYIFGYRMGIAEGKKNFPVELVDFDEFVAGMKAALKLEEGRVTSERYAEAARIFQALEIERRTKVADANAKFADEFLAKNGKAKGIQTMGEGRLQYVVADKGKGTKQPKSSDWVKVHYEVRLVEPGKEPKDYKVIESTKIAGKPADMPMGNLIEGWKQALGQMKEGAKWTLWVPPELAYEEEGNGRVIPPNALLYFELELIKVLTKEERDAILEQVRKEREQQSAEQEAVGDDE
jgi:FKBP-type peptidyl-prolyl cis-trans isomerase